ncbi:MAG: prolyl oligopeptidase family serine peptidase [Pseudomonadota bacterium]
MRNSIFILAFCLCLSSNVNASPRQADAFFGFPDMTLATLAPSGDKVATISFRDGYQRLSVTDITSGASTTLMDLSQMSEGDAVASDVEWIDDTQLAVQYEEILDGVDRLVDTKLISYLLVVQLPQEPVDEPRLLRLRTTGQLVSALPAEQDTLLYAKSGVKSRIYKISTSELSEAGARLGKLDKVDGGQFIARNQVAAVDGFAMRWFLDIDGTPQASLTLHRGGIVKLNELGDNAEFEMIKEWDRLADDDDDEADPLRDMVPMLMAAEPNSYYCFSYNKDERNAIYKVDFSSGDRELVYQNDTHEIKNLILSPDKDEVVGVRVLRDGGLHNVYLGNAGDNALTSADTQEIDITLDRSLDGSRSLQYRESHAQPGTYWLTNHETAEEQRIGAVIPRLVDQLESRLIEDSVVVEGLEIPYLLTLPGDAASAPVPLIVMPHGGPIGVFDDRYFDAPTQYLAANGFAVLRVNFRGSSGYSSELREAGKMQWGKLMLTDIHTATSAVIARDDIDASRVCAFGASYGGYAALMLAIKHPDTYRCASSLAGVTDLNLFVETPYASATQRRWLRENVGDSEENFDELKSLSPVYLAAQLSQPVQIMHGSDDTVVDVEHAHRLRLVLDKAGKVHQFNIFDGEGHRLDDLDTRQQFFSMLTEFLNTEIGVGPTS